MLASAKGLAELFAAGGAISMNALSKTFIAVAIDACIVIVGVVVVRHKPSPPPGPPTAPPTAPP